MIFHGLFCWATALDQPVQIVSAVMVGDKGNKGEK
jgi:hypothetical protein